MNTPHTHPRATELNYVVSGNFTTGFFAENGAQTVLGTVGPGQMSVFPRGSIHFEANLGCEPATFVAPRSEMKTLECSRSRKVSQLSRGSDWRARADPHSTGLFGLPPTIIGATLGGGLTPEQITVVSHMIPANVAFGLDECLARCGLNATGTAAKE